MEQKNALNELIKSGQELCEYQIRALTNPAYAAWVAVKCNNTAVAKKLINNLDLNQYSIHTGFFPLHFAVVNNNLTLVNVLLERGDNIHKETLFGYSVLELALNMNPRNSKLIQFLCARGAISEQFLLDNSCEMPKLKVNNHSSTITTTINHLRISCALPPIIDCFITARNKFRPQSSENTNITDSFFGFINGKNSSDDKESLCKLFNQLDTDSDPWASTTIFDVLIAILRHPEFRTVSDGSVCSSVVEQILKHPQLPSLINLCLIGTRASIDTHDTVFNQHSFTIDYKMSCHDLEKRYGIQKYRLFYRDYLLELLLVWRNITASFHKTMLQQPSSTQTHSAHRPDWFKKLPSGQRGWQQGLENVQPNSQLAEVALYLAAKDNNLAVLSQVIPKVSRFNISRILESTPYYPEHWAIQHGNLEMLESLVKAGAHKNRDLSHAESLIKLALTRQPSNSAIAHLICEHFFVKSPAYLYFAKKRDWITFEKLLKACVDCTAQTLCEVLILAIEANQTTLCRTILDHPAGQSCISLVSTNQVIRSGKIEFPLSPLHAAVNDNCPELLDKMMKLKPDLTTFSDASPLALAILSNSRLTEILLRHPLTNINNELKFIYQHAQELRIKTTHLAAIVNRLLDTVSDESQKEALYKDPALLKLLINADNDVKVLSIIRTTGADILSAIHEAIKADSWCCVNTLIQHHSELTNQLIVQILSLISDDNLSNLTKSTLSHLLSGESVQDDSDIETHIIRLLNAKIKTNKAGAVALILQYAIFDYDSAIKLAIQNEAWECLTELILQNEGLVNDKTVTKIIDSNYLENLSSICSRETMSRVITRLIDSIPEAIRYSEYDKFSRVIDDNVNDQSIARLVRSYEKTCHDFDNELQECIRNKRWKMAKALLQFPTKISNYACLHSLRSILGENQSEVCLLLLSKIMESEDYNPHDLRGMAEGAAEKKDWSCLSALLLYGSSICTRDELVSLLKTCIRKNQPKLCHELVIQLNELSGIKLHDVLSLLVKNNNMLLLYLMLAAGAQLDANSNDPITIASHFNNRIAISLLCGETKVPQLARIELCQSWPVIKCQLIHSLLLIAAKCNDEKAFAKLLEELDPPSIKTELFFELIKQKRPSFVNSLLDGKFAPQDPRATEEIRQKLTEEDETSTQSENKINLM